MGRCRCGIDIHAHVVPATFPSYHPVNFHERRPVERIEAAFADETTRKRLLHDNAATFRGRAVERAS
jgi:hypothetical protein